VPWGLLDSPSFHQGRAKSSQMFGETPGGEVFVQPNIFTKQIKFTVARHAGRVRSPFQQLARC